MMVEDCMFLTDDGMSYHDRQKNTATSRERKGMGMGSI